MRTVIIIAGHRLHFGTLRELGYFVHISVRLSPSFRFLVCVVKR